MTAAQGTTACSSLRALWSLTSLCGLRSDGHPPFASSRDTQVVSERISRLEDVTAAIEKYTDEIAGANKGVSSTPISLRVHSPNAPDLTLIDLPGITRVPVGDQPEDIYARVKTLILKYIQGACERSARQNGHSAQGPRGTARHETDTNHGTTHDATSPGGKPSRTTGSDRTSGLS